MSLAEEELSYQLIGKAMEGHRALGPGVDEVFYHRLLSENLTEAGIEHVCKPRRILTHRGHTADIFEPDLVFPGRLITELKWLWGGFAPEHYVQLKSYLKLWCLSHGLLMDFGKESLVVKRYVYQDSFPCPFDVASALRQVPPAARESGFPGAVCEAVARLAAEYGLGYRDTTYRGLLAADFLAEGLRVTSSPGAVVCAGGRRLGETRLPCLVLGEEGAVMVLSQRKGIRPADRAILRSWLLHLGLAWGVIVHFGKREVEVRWAHRSLV